MDPTEGIGNQQEQIGLESDSLESAAVALATGVTRRRQRTEKGKSYIAHLRWTDCQTIDKRIERQIKEIVSLTTTEENVDVVERNLTAFRVTVEELRRSVAVLLDDLEGEAEQLNIANDWYAERSKQISDFILFCVVCRRLRGSPGEQKMADLPKERITPSPPFTYSGVDYFGPFYIKQGWKDVKRYGVLFTCLASRAMHIETADTLETDSFIYALRRFVARRGPVREIRSDQGTNIVGAERELKKALDELDHSAIQRSLSRDFNADWIIQWKQNPPAASHMGGVWERQIQSVRSTLSALMRNHGHTLDDESFRTLLAEVECIINSRPLTVPSSDPEDLDPLTPNHILTMKSRVVMPPPGNFQKADLYLRKRWKRVQYLSNVFWSRWRKEYVQNLQQRVKWNRPRRNFEKGDLVLIVDDRAPRNDWSMARVIDVHPDSNGHVRSVRVTTATTTLDRPIDKLVLILENEE